jgi:hypothetical protein
VVIRYWADGCVTTWGPRGYLVFHLFPFTLLPTAAAFDSFSLGISWPRWDSSSVVVAWHFWTLSYQLYSQFLSTFHFFVFKVRSVLSSTCVSSEFTTVSHFSSQFSTQFSAVRSSLFNMFQLSTVLSSQFSTQLSVFSSQFQSVFKFSVVFKVSSVLN